MRSFLELFFVLLVGLGLGSYLSWTSIQRQHGFGAINIGSWTAWPLAGSPSADPYTKAKVAADGDVPLGAAEGLAFQALQDSKGRPLKLECRYVVSGQTPPARFWTFSAHDTKNTPIRLDNGQISSIVSTIILRDTAGKFSIEVGSQLASGNWLPITGKGDFKLFLRLYDSPITSTSGIVDPEMPTIVEQGCGS